MDAPDRVLVEKWVAERDAVAFHELVSRHAGLVFGTARRVLGDPAKAEDVTQEAFLRLAQRGVEVRTSVPGWLHTLSLRLSLNLLRSERRRKTREKAFAETPTRADQPDSAVLAHVDEAVAALPDDLRQPILLHFFEQQTQQQIADVLGVSRSTVSRRIEEGIERIRRQLQGNGVAVTAAVLAGTLGEVAQAAPARTVEQLARVALAGNGFAHPSFPAGSLLMQAGAHPLRWLAVAIAVVVVGGGVWLVRPAGETGAERTAVVESVMSVDGNAAEASVADVAEAGHEEHSPARFVYSPLARPVSSTEENLVGGSIGGKTTIAETGEPLPNVGFSLEIEGGGAETRTVASASDGTYTFNQLPPSSYVLTPEYPADFVQETVGLARRPQRWIELAPEEHVNGINFSFERGTFISGRVIDRYGAPIASAELSGSSIDRPSQSYRVVLSGVSDADGNYRVLGVRPGLTYVLTAVADGYHGLSVPVPAPGKDGVSGVDFVLGPEATVSGVVVDSDGRRIPEAEVELSASLEHYKRLQRGNSSMTPAANATANK